MKEFAESYITRHITSSCSIHKQWPSRDSSEDSEAANRKSNNSSHGFQYGLSPAELLMRCQIKPDVPQLKKTFISNWPHLKRSEKPTNKLRRDRNLIMTSSIKSVFSQSFQTIHCYGQTMDIWGKCYLLITPDHIRRKDHLEKSSETRPSLGLGSRYARRQQKFQTQQKLLLPNQKHEALRYPKLR